MRNLVFLLFISVWASSLNAQWFSIKAHAGGSQEIHRSERIERSFNGVQRKIEGMDTIYLASQLNQVNEDLYLIRGLQSLGLDVLVDFSLNEHFFVEGGLGFGFASFDYYKRNIFISSEWIPGDTLENYVPPTFDPDFTNLPDGCDSLYMPEVMIPEGTVMLGTPSPKMNNQIATIRVPLAVKYRIVPELFNLSLGVVTHIPVYNRQRHSYPSIEVSPWKSTDSIAVCEMIIASEVFTNTPSVSNIYFSTSVGLELQIVPELLLHGTFGQFITPINANIMKDELSSEYYFPYKLRPSHFTMGISYIFGSKDSIREKQSKHLYSKGLNAL